MLITNVTPINQAFYKIYFWDTETTNDTIDLSQNVSAELLAH
jgi:hypothetical protein